MPAESTALSVLHKATKGDDKISAWQIKAREHAVDFGLAWSLKGEC